MPPRRLDWFTKVLAEAEVSTFSDKEVTVLWMIPIVFFFVMCFFLQPIMQEVTTIFDQIISFAYAAGTTILAWHVYRKHYVHLEHKPFNLITLVFIPLTLAYVTVFEVAFNTYRFFEPGFLEDHLQYHIFSDTLVFIAMFSTMWLFFQKTSVGKYTILFSYMSGIVFEAFFAGETGSGFGGIIAGALWIWVLHINWFFTGLLIRERRNISINRHDSA